MTCSTPAPMCGAITAPGGVSTTQGADPSIVKYTAPVNRIARSTSESVSTRREYRTGHAPRARGSVGIRSRAREGAWLGARDGLEVVEKAVRGGGMVAAGRNGPRRVANVVGEVHRAEEDVQRGVEPRLTPADRQLQLHLQRGEQEHRGAVHVGDDVVAIGAPAVVQIGVE